MTNLHLPMQRYVSQLVGQHTRDGTQTTLKLSHVTTSCHTTRILLSNIIFADLSNRTYPVKISPILGPDDIFCNLDFLPSNTKSDRRYCIPNQKIKKSKQKKNPTPPARMGVSARPGP